MRLLSTLYVVEHGSRIGLQKSALVVATPTGQRSRIPINSLDGVVLAGHAQVSTDALAECVTKGIRVAALSRGGRLRFHVGGPVNGNVHLRLAQAQAAADPQHATALARWFVAGKLQNCRRLLLRWTSDARGIARSVMRTNADVIAQRLAALGDAHDGDTIRGLEGDGTRRYFKGLAAHLSVGEEELAFAGRSRRPPVDPVNALLSFVYGLLLAEVVGALDARGLDPQIGFLHGVRAGRPSLALDMLEEFRPAVADRFVARTVLRRELRPEHFVHTPGGACYLNDDGRRVALGAYETFRSEEVPHGLVGRDIVRASLPIVQATLLARHLRGDLHTYPPFVMDG